MQKNIKKQKIMYYLFLVMALVAFIFSLSFMTDFAGLFGLKMAQNEHISEFHNVTLQTFTKTMFYLSVIGILIFVSSLFLEINKKIVDKFALVFMGISLLFVILSSVYGIVNLISLEEIYLALDFSYFEIEGGEYIMNTRSFSIGIAIYTIQAIFSVCYFTRLFKNHQAFIKCLGGAK